MKPKPIIFCGCVAFMIVLLIIPGLIYLARRLHIIDMPDGRLKQHVMPTPYLGGLGVYLGIFIAVLFFSDNYLRIIPLWLGSTILLLLGLCDDIYVISPKNKLAGQLLATVIFLVANYLINQQSITHYWPIYIILILYILTVINAVNLIDVMDGLTGTVVLGSSIAFLLFALSTNATTEALFLMALLGALLGFLVYNLPPAKIYLGDSGSLFLGGILAYLPFYLDWTIYNQWGYILPIVLLALPLLELCSLIVIRMTKKLPVYLGSPDHFSIYLQQRQWSKRRILLFVACSSLILAIVAIFFYFNLISLISLILLGLCFNLFWFATIFA